MTNPATMKYRNLGNSGLKVSLFSLGGWTTFGGSISDERLVKNILYAAFEAGINFFDIADIYAKGESERIMGKILRDFPRHRLVISSKLFWPMSDDVNDCGLSRKHIMESVDKSLKRIGTDYLDMYFCHRFDEHTPVEETARAMDDLVRAGKVLYWGTSEWSGEQIRRVAAVCDRRNLYFPAVEQPQYNLLTRSRFEGDVAPVCRDLGMGTVVWSPLASGMLTGKYDQGIPDNSRLARIDWLKDGLYTEDKIARVREFGRVAADVGVTRSQLALAWAAANPAVSSVILGATSLEQLAENLGGLRVNMSTELKLKLESIFLS
jgi:voltage-dependent potassium channel beta subunit